MEQPPVLPSYGQDQATEDVPRSVPASEYSTTAPYNNNEQHHIPALFAMRADSKEDVGDNPQIHDGIITSHPERNTLSTIDILPLTQHVRDPLEEGTIAEDIEDRPMDSRYNSDVINLPSTWRDSNVPSESEGANGEERPGLPHLNTLQRKEIDMIPVATAPVATDALAQYGQVESKTPHIVQPGEPGYIHPWDRRHPSYYGNQGDIEVVPGIQRPASTASRPKSILRETPLEHPQPIYPAGNAIANMDRSYSKTSTAGKPASIAESRRANIMDSMAGVHGESFYLQLTV